MLLLDLFITLESITIFGNSLLSYAGALAYFLGLLLLFHVLQYWLVRWIKGLTQRTVTEIDDVFIRVIETIKPPFYLYLAFYLSLHGLMIDAFIHSIARGLLVVWVAWQIILALQVAIDSVFLRRMKREPHSSHQSILEVMRGVVRFVLWTVGILFILSNLGVNISSLIAGLGISGIAIALATQNILTDLFSSLVIYFDQPFEAGDFIEVGDDMGTVLKIGIKTTRIRSLRGEELIIPNKDIAAARVKNFKRLLERRVEFTLFLPYETPSEKLAALPGIIKGLIEATEHTRFERAHLHAIEGDKLRFTIVYVVLKREFKDYMDVHQAVLLGLKKALDTARIEVI